jgi:hypothetical protein
VIVDLLFLNAWEKRSERDALARDVLARNRARGWTIATAESCTGGLVSAALTEIAGSSEVFDRGSSPIRTPPRSASWASIRS